MADPIRIANCSGFFGDRLSAAVEMVEGGPIDVLTGDWLAELTMLILARTQARHPGGGYARTFVTQMEQVMGSCIDKDIKVVTNAGGLDPASCAEAVAEVADKLGLSPSIAFVEGDNLLPRLDELTAVSALLDFETGEPLANTGGLISANAYLGCWGIVDALNRGADIVITGRTTDAAVVCGPAAWHHGWLGDDYDELAGAVVAGHVIECGTQATGGNYSFFTELDGLTHTGFPWAEIAADGSCVIGKHAGTGGEVTLGTITSQLLYEIGSPSYLGPDVNARFDTIRLIQQGHDRVGISETRGEPPPETLKVATNEMGGFRSDISVALTGLDIEAKAELVESAFWAACKYKPEDFDEVTTAVVRTDKQDPASNEEAVASWRLTVKHHDESMLGRALQSAVNELALATIPGMFGLGGGRPKAFGVYRPAVVPAELVPQLVTVDAESSVVDPHVPDRGPDRRPEVAAIAHDLPLFPAGDTARVPLGRIIGARSGDKGGNA
ncbi:MAG: acyclic terpene utilization AtuA family protein, partial [Acidimicrobiales bacterium]